MAHAARLNLRMQKELKLLLTDPPPGVSLPLLTADSDSSSLSAIDAQIDGPEGTVYAKGVFNIKIQIPDRYPFQPPIVTFATPIYHPNIDNGGRICLDILNLPPKGAWQPSLNISTVLTSLGLLLSEPNPDDGLMCEASREYKYNRQAFDQKARSMTEKFAKAGGSVNCSSSGGTSCNTDPNTMQAEVSETESKAMVNECNFSLKKLHRVSKKLSLESSSLSQRTGANKKEHVMVPQQLSLAYSESLPATPSTPSKSLLIPQAGSHEVQKPHQDHDRRANGNENAVSKKPLGISRKLSMESSGQFQRRDDYSRNRLPVDQQSLLSPSKNHCTAFSEPLRTPQAGNHNKQPHQDHDWKRVANGTTEIHKKLCRISQGTSLHTLGSDQRDDDSKENVEPMHKSLVPHFHSQGLPPDSSKPSRMPQRGNCYEQPNGKMKNGTIDVNLKKVHNVGANLSLESLGKLKKRGGDKENEVIAQLPPSHSQSHSPKSMSHPFNSNEQHRQDHDTKDVNSSIKQLEEEVSPITETVIVLDSEDSEEENRGLKRPRLSLARKRLTGSCKAKA